MAPSKTKKTTASKWVTSGIISLFLYLLPLGGFAQQNFNTVKKEIAGLYPEVNFDGYAQLFVIHFSFCSSTNYCGQNLIDFIAQKASKPTLVIYDTEEDKYLNQLRQIHTVSLLLVPIEYMQEHGFFSVYNLWYRNKKKVKKLI